MLLSIGYSSCHWCHVMERECFENEVIARLMNQDFINIEVDREERPDLDHIFMEAVQAITGRGGWPLTVFLTPGGDPYYGGAYFAPMDAHGLPGFPKVLKIAAEAYRSERSKVEKSAAAVRAYLEELSTQKPAEPGLSEDILKQGFRNLAAAFDQENGGFGAAPKFPQPLALEFLLRYYRRSGETQARGMVEKSLAKMARGGIYDHLGGGFHRYATDAIWLAPHFEKMLYDNALLSRTYLHAFQVTGRTEFRDTVEGILEYVRREMTAPEGGFFSAQDADSEGEEGRYYLWTVREIRSIVGGEESEALTRYYGIGEAGNFEGKNILHVTTGLEDLAVQLGVRPEALEKLLKDGREKLLAHREKRVRPGTDEKVLAGWNGLMMAALAEAGRVLQEPRYLEAARRNASFLLRALWKDGHLLRVYTAGESKIPAFLEDYASLGMGLLTLYEATLEPDWLETVLDMAVAMVDRFWEEEPGVFFDTAAAQGVPVRPRNLFDNALPCGGSQAADLLLRLGLLTGNNAYTRIATRAMESVAPYLTDQPLGFGHWLCSLDVHFSHPLELAIIGPSGDERTRALLQVVYNNYLPNKVIAGWDGTTPSRIGALPLLEGRAMLNGMPTAYLCQAYRCLAPASGAGDLAAQISALPP